MNRLAALILAMVLVGAGGALALAASSNMPKHQGNAAITQYVPTPPVVYQPPSGGGGTPEQETKHFKKHHHSKKHNGGNGNGNGNKGKHGAGNGGPGSGNGSGPSQGVQAFNGESGTEPVSLNSAATGPSGGAGGLPFTGFDVVALFGVGALLLLVGLAQRRLSSPRQKP